MPKAVHVTKMISDRWRDATIAFFTQPPGYAYKKTIHCGEDASLIVQALLGSGSLTSHGLRSK